MTRIVSDMDGTLLDSTEVVPDAFVETVRELEVEDFDREKVVAAYSLSVPEMTLQHLVGRNLEDHEIDLYYNRLLEGTVAPYDGVLETLDALRHLNLPIVIFTGASSRAGTDPARLSGHPIQLARWRQSRRPTQARS